MKKKLRIVILAVILAVIAFIGYTFVSSDSGIVSPVPDKGGVKVIPLK